MEITFKTGRVPGVYCITNKKNNKRYIGSSIKVYGRIMEHLSDLRNNNHHSLYLQRAWNLYGEENFDIVFLEKCDNGEKELRKCEKKWIDILNPEYNIMKDPVNKTCEESSRKLISATLKKRYKNGEIPVQIPPGSSIPINVYNFKEELIGKFRSITDTKKKIEKFRNVSLANNLRRKNYFCRGYIIVPEGMLIDDCIDLAIKNSPKKPYIKITKNNDPELISKNDISFYYQSWLDANPEGVVLIKCKSDRLDRINKGKFYMVRMGYYRRNNVHINLKKLQESL